MNIRTFTPHLSIVVALVTLSGLTLHDTKIDVMTSFAVALPIALVSYEGAHAMLLYGQAHTHVERVSLSELAGRYTSSTPKIRTRKSQDINPRLNKSVPKGHHPFDNYSLLIAS